MPLTTRKYDVMVASLTALTHPYVASELLDEPHGRFLDGLCFVHRAAHNHSRHVDTGALLKRHADAERILDGFDWRRVDIRKRLQNARHRKFEHEHEW